MKNRVYELKNQRQEYVGKMEAAMEARDKAAFDAAKAEVEKLNGEIGQAEALLAEQGRFDDCDRRMATLHDTARDRKREDAQLSRVDAARSGNDYVNAFAYAIRNGIGLQNGRHVEACAPLYAALKETGGTPDGADGGFLVPVDFDTTIHELRRELRPLSDLFTVETVNTLTGWRILDTAPMAGFTPVDEMEEIPKDDQPKFSKIGYSVKKYGLIVPLSAELIADNTAGLMRYLAGWFAKKSVITENRLLLALLAALTPDTVTVGDEVKAVKRALNVTLDPSISVNASILTNQSGFSALDELQDDSGKPLMQPVVTDATQYRLLGRRVREMSNRFMANGEGTAPLYIGDFRQFATVFRRKAMELATTAIGGDAWKTDSVEVRGIMRLDVQKFDPEAVTALSMPTA